MGLYPGTDELGSGTFNNGEGMLWIIFGVWIFQAENSASTNLGQKLRGWENFPHAIISYATLQLSPFSLSVALPKLYM